jgi:hypothetical protein
MNRIEAPDFNASTAQCAMAKALSYLSDETRLV